MTMVEHIIGGVLMVMSIGCASYWSVGICKILRGLFGGFSARRGLALPIPTDETGASPLVRVVVPCFNEAHAVGPLVRSLLAQDYPNLRFVFALDRCTDGTRGVIEREAQGDDRVEFVEITECPDGWAGKVHAMHRAVRQSPPMGNDDYLLFIDADCELEPRCIRATVAIAHDRTLDLLSLWSTLARKHWFEKVVQPSTTMELIRQYPLKAANRDANRRSMANGQFMLFRREGYDAVGGIESVRHFVLEDIEIARKIKHASRRSGVLLAKDLLVCRMYDDFASYRRGWERIFIECARRRSPRLRAFAQRKLLVHLALPGSALAALVWGSVLLAQGMPFFPSPAVLVISGGAGSLAYWGSMSVLYGAQGLLLYLPTLPVGNAMTIWIMFAASKRLREGGTIRWGGREYQLIDQGRKRKGSSVRPATSVSVEHAVPRTE